MAKNVRNTEPADAALTLADLVQRQTLDGIDPVPQVLATLAHARDAQVEAEGAYARAQEEAAGDPHPRSRRAARRSLDELRDAVQDARDDVAAAQHALAVARREAFAVAAPIIQREHASRLPRLTEALNELSAACVELQEVEQVAGNYQLASASIAPSRSPLAGEIAAQLLAQIEHWRRVIAAHQPSRAA